MSENKSASFSIFSILAIIAAICSFYPAAFWGFVLAGLAFLFGVIGMILAVSPKTRGGILSILAVIMSLVGVVVAIFKFIAWIF